MSVSVPERTYVIEHDAPWEHWRRLYEAIEAEPHERFNTKPPAEHVTWTHEAPRAPWWARR